MKSNLPAAVEALAEVTRDAYSADRFTSWRAVVRVFLSRLTPSEAEAWLRSKHLRWAADMSGKRYGRATSADVKRYLSRYSEKQLDDETAYLVAGTFGWSGQD